MKTCSKCGFEKPLEEFKPDKRNKSGYGAECLNCARERNRQWVKDNLEKVSERNKEWHRNNPGKMAAYMRKSIAKRKATDFRPFIFQAAKARANTRNIEFCISVEDIIIPETCPILGVPLKISIGKGPSDNSPSLDRKDPSKGYIPGNVWVISQRANRIKNDATLEELRRIVEALERLTTME